MNNDNQKTLRLLNEAVGDGNKKLIKSLRPEIFRIIKERIKTWLQDHKTYSIYHIILSTYVDLLEKTKDRKNKNKLFNKTLLDILQDYCHQNQIQIYTDVKECRPGDIICEALGFTYQYYEEWTDWEGEYWWICKRLFEGNGTKVKIKPFKSITAGIHTDPAYTFCLKKHFFFITF